jgi:CRP/FNR family transcriptional regulator, cyclic AMP receptor protein
MVTTEVLKSVPLFSTLPEDQLTSLAACATLHNYPRGTFILHAGEETDGLYIMLSGRAKVLIIDEKGREVILSSLGPFDFFGEMGLLDDQPRSASVETIEFCELMRISKVDFNRCLTENFDIAIRIMRGLVKRLREADRKIASLALMDVHDRVARALLDMAEHRDGKFLIPNAPAKTEIARMVGATREMVGRVMKELESSGQILIDRRSIVVLDKLASRQRLQ